MIKYKNLVEEIFSHLVAYLYENINDFGKYLAIDGKIIESYANTSSQSSVKDGRRELYELPIAVDVLPANVAEQLINQLPTAVTQQAQYLMADKGYDSTRLIELLEDKNITPIIPNRQMWKDKETRQYLDTDLVYDQNGKVYYKEI